ncbi:TIGR00159 family protein [Weissella diestrammenae]|uniref:Diadenylate cyclase n=1 Tax=Weissella diestrammenae TaxID=1162633 RepID=A0A7G9T415_9LACO|nr:diadenylate cyclase CdaA [Weissella diestrammenae]MCM0583038.1 diadenylate cyclase CdaA [Weissella diestrammenae]QNN74840.1 TIGR00159 family protein [Weissella diestrammenae]
MNFASVLSNISVVRIIDVILVWYLIYRLMMLMRGTKAFTLIRGVAIVIVVKLVSVSIGLTTISWLTDQIINWGAIMLVIVFQPEIRRGLEHLGRSQFFKKQSREEGLDLVEQLDEAVVYMSKRKIGALITIEMETGLEEYIETGIKMDAQITSALLINTFIPNTPLHDGAVIIKDDRIAVAAAYLPLSDNPTIPKELGTRHRAGVGISEVTDSLTIIVSEETGGITITRNAELMQDLTHDDFLKYLTVHLVSTENKGSWFDRLLFSTWFKRKER